MESTEAAPPTPSVRGAACLSGLLLPQLYPLDPEFPHLPEFPYFRLYIATTDRCSIASCTASTGYS
jgi:hypothetical protein